jgi:outer membrane protein assembly factor BamB/uncharacterized protein YraI
MRTKIFSLILAVCLTGTIMPMPLKAASEPMDWNTRYADSGNTNHSNATLPIELTLSQKPIDNASANFVIEDGKLYTIERIGGKKLYVIDVKTNTVRWEFASEGDVPFYELVAKDGVIYARSENKLYAITDGGSAPLVKWSREPVGGRMAIGQNTLFSIKDNQQIVAIDLETGADKWNYTIKPTDQLSFSKLAAGGNRVYVTMTNRAEMDYTMYAFSEATGQVLWIAALGSSGIQSSNLPVYTDEKVYLDRHDSSRRTNPGSITAFDAATGNTLWQYPVSTYFEGPLSVNNESVIAADKNGHLMAVDKNTGEKKWEVFYADFVTQAGRTSIVSGSSMLLTSDKIVLANNNKLKFFHSANGTLLHATPVLQTATGGSGVTPVGVIDSMLFVREANNMLYTMVAVEKDITPPSAQVEPISSLAPENGTSRWSIPFSISEEAYVTVHIVDEKGSRVRRFDLGLRQAGENNVVWDGKTNTGFDVAHGSYYPVLEMMDAAGNRGTLQAQDKIMVVSDKFGWTTSNVNMRTAPGTQYGVTTVVPVGSEVKIVGETAGWYQVEYRKVTAVLKGYVSKSYVTLRSNALIAQDLTGTARQNVNMRRGPGTQYETMVVIPANSPVKVKGSYGDWYWIEYQNGSTFHIGHVAKYLISVSMPKPVVHVVQAGDTLWKIAQKYGTTVDAIIKANNLDPNKYLFIGQKVSIPQ